MLGFASGVPRHDLQCVPTETVIICWSRNKRRERANCVLRYPVARWHAPTANLFPSLF